MLVFTHSEMLMRAAKVVHVMDEGVIVESAEYSDLKSLVGISSWKDIWRHLLMLPVTAHALR